MPGGRRLPILLRDRVHTCGGGLIAVICSFFSADTIYYTFRGGQGFRAVLNSALHITLGKLVFIVTLTESRYVQISNFEGVVISA